MMDRATSVVKGTAPDDSWPAIRALSTKKMPKMEPGSSRAVLSVSRRHDEPLNILYRRAAP